MDKRTWKRGDNQIMSLWIIAICLMIMATPNALLFVAFMIALLGGSKE